MMELIYLPSPYQTIGKRRVELWRRGIFLFDKTEREEGPFHKAGYEDYWCEGKSNEKLTPDIFGFSDNYFCVCDVSMSSQKGHEMEKYKGCTPSEYMKSLFPTEKERESAGSPFLITDEFGLKKEGGYNIVHVYQPGGATIDCINDRKLKEILEKWTGILNPPPSYSLLAVPESSPDELKNPLAGILKWAASNSDWITFEEVAEKLLGKLYTSFSRKAISELRKKIQNIIYDLHKGILKEFIIYDNNGRFKVDIDTTSPQKRKAFSSKIHSWLKLTPIEYFIKDDELDEDNEEDDYDE